MIAAVILVSTTHLLFDSLRLSLDGVPSGVVAPEELRRPVEALERLGRQGWQGRCRLLPYQAVGVECGMLLALRLDGARVGTEDYGKLLLALSPTRLTDGGGYHALIGT